MASKKAAKPKPPATPTKYVFAGQRDGAVVVKKGQTLSSIAKRYYGKAASWTLIRDANPQLADPNKLRPGMTLVVPASTVIAKQAAALTFYDPDGKNVYTDYPWIEIPTGKLGSVSAAVNAYFENTLLVYDATSSSPALYLKYGTFKHHQQNMDRKLQPGHRYYFAAWHKVQPEKGKGELKDQPWRPSRVRLLMLSNGFAVQVDDSEPSKKPGDADYNDLVMTVSIA